MTGGIMVGMMLTKGCTMQLVGSAETTAELEEMGLSPPHGTWSSGESFEGEFPARLSYRPILTFTPPSTTLMEPMNCSKWNLCICPTEGEPWSEELFLSSLCAHETVPPD